MTLVARREAVLRELADALSDAHGVRTEVIAADLTEMTDRESVASGLAERGLAVEVLVNNAGFSTMGPVERSDVEREVAMVRTNVEAVVDLCSRFVPAMVGRGRGAVLNVASTAAFQPLPAQAGYGASKAFVLSYTQALRAELSGTGVTATALCPGPVETGFAEAAGISDDAASKSLPSFMWVEAPVVAKEAVAALAAGQPVVIPGLANKLTAVSGYLTPRRLLMPLLRRQHPAMRRR